MSANYDVSRLADQILRNSEELSVVLVPRGLVGPGGEPAPLPQEASRSASQRQDTVTDPIAGTR